MGYEMITEQVLSVTSPVSIFLFGSQAKGTATSKSDYDFCVIAPTQNKRELLTNLYLNVEADRPIDFLLYTPEEWNSHLEDVCSFAHKINKEGVRIYG